MAGFEQLCSTLQVSSENETSDSLASIREWCLNHVSASATSLTYQGYMDLARRYLDVFLPNLPNNRMQNLAVFKHMNTLQYAAYYGFDRFLKSDIEHLMTLLDSQTDTGMTALHFAASGAHTAVVDILLDAGASVRILNQRLKYPLQSALFTPIASPEYMHKRTLIFKQLQAVAPDLVDAIGEEGKRVAHIMAEYGYYELMKEMIAFYGADFVSKADNFNHYPMHDAILNHQKEIIQLLLDTADVRYLENGQAQIALHDMAKEGDADMIRLACLYYSKEDINRRDREGKTPLICAAENGNWDTFISLIAQGADVALKSDDGKTLLHHAASGKSSEIVEWILQHTDMNVHTVDLGGRSALCAAKGDIAHLLQQHNHQVKLIK